MILQQISPTLCCVYNPLLQTLYVSRSSDPKPLLTLPKLGAVLEKASRVLDYPSHRFTPRSKLTLKIINGIGKITTETHPSNVHDQSTRGFLKNGIDTSGITAANICLPNGIISLGV